MSKSYGIRIFVTLILVLSLSLGMTGCVLKFDEDKYMTREEVENLIDDSMVGDVTVEGGDTVNVTINGAQNPNVAAAAKGLLSTVSVSCYFEYDSGYGPNYTTSRTETRKGAGVIYRLDKERGDAYVITNYHVVYEHSSGTKGHISDSMYIELFGMENCGKEIYCEYVGGSLYFDIAVLKITNSRILAESNAVAATFASSDEVCVLDTAIAIGNPEGGGISATVGYVNVDSENIELLAADEKTAITIRVMRIDTAVNEGNSGGGLFNAEGNLIGIVNAKTSSDEVENIGYAIPSDLVKSVTENILYHCDETAVTCVKRCVVGLRVGAAEKYTEYDTETGRIYKKEVVEITGVTSGSASDGLLSVGDVIRSVEIDGVVYEADRTHKATECMLNARVGSTVVFNITRGGVDMSVTVPITDATVTDW